MKNIFMIKSWTDSVLFVIVLLTVVSCKKEDNDGIVNDKYNNQGLVCLTCPSLFYDYADIPPLETICDDFTSSEWPQGTLFYDGDTIGYTQGGISPIVLKTDAFCAFNSSEPGIYLIGPASFRFNGDFQIAQFEIYGFNDQYDQMGFEVNGNGFISLGDDFPLSIGDVVVDLDMSAENIGVWEYSYLIFEGVVNEIEITGFESGIVNLCVTTQNTPPEIEKTGSVYFDDFIDDDGNITGSYPNSKTPLGYYGLQGASLVVKFDEFLGYSPVKISFVHSYFKDDNTTLINIQLPGTPLIICTPDSLSSVLTYYGYQTNYYHFSSGLMWQNESSEPVSGASIDSIIISGSDLNQIKIGADMNSSELRSICSILE